MRIFVANHNEMNPDPPVPHHVVHQDGVPHCGVPHNGLQDDDVPPLEQYDMLSEHAEPPHQPQQGDAQPRQQAGQDDQPDLQDDDMPPMEQYVHADQPLQLQHEDAQPGQKAGQDDQPDLQVADVPTTENPVTPTLKKFRTHLTTPKRKRSPGLETPLKIPRLLFLAKEPEIPPKKTRKNPHPHKNQQMFVKIDSKLVLLKHKGLAPSTRKSKPKKPPKSPISSTYLQIPTNLQDQLTNPPNPRRRSDHHHHFEEKLRIFQQEKTMKSASTHLHPSANSLEQKFKNLGITRACKAPWTPQETFGTSIFGKIYKT